MEKKNAKNQTKASSGIAKTRAAQKIAATITPAPETEHIVTLADCTAEYVEYRKPLEMFFGELKAFFGKHLVLFKLVQGTTTDIKLRKRPTVRIYVHETCLEQANAAILEWKANGHRE